RVVATLLCSGRPRLRRFGLGRAVLILQVSLLAFLFAFELPRHIRQPLWSWLGGTGRGAGRRRGSATNTAGRGGLGLGTNLYFVRMSLGLLDLNVEQVTNGFVVD